MRPSNLTPPAHPASPADISRAEETLGVVLPAGLTRALRLANGFVIDDTRGSTTERWRVLPVRDHSSRRRMSLTAEDIVWYTERARADGELPPSAVVVARASTPWNRLLLLPDPAQPSHLGETVHRQVGMGEPIAVAASIADLGIVPSSRTEPVEHPGPLPYFRFHPYPLATGAIAPSRARCARCERRRGYTYTSTLYAPANVQALCPWCVADGSAAEAFGASFVDANPLIDGGVPQDLVDEVCRRTPGFSTFQTEVWQVCCRTPGAFRGPLSAEGMAGLSDEELEWMGVSTWQWNLWRAMDPATTGVAVFVFECTRCGRRRPWADIP